MRTLAAFAVALLVGCGDGILDPVSRPEAVIEADVTSGVAPLPVRFSGARSHWKEGRGFYRWNFGDKTPEIEGVGVVLVEHTYTRSGEFKACLFFGNADYISKACLPISVK